MMQSVMVFYGLAVALIAVSVWQTYSDTSQVVTEEAISLAAFYRDVSSYPKPARAGMQNELRGYTKYVIEEAWALHRQGKVPGGGVGRMNPSRPYWFRSSRRELSVRRLLGSFSIYTLRYRQLWFRCRREKR